MQAVLFDGIPGHSTHVAGELTAVCCQAWKFDCLHFQEVFWWLQDDATSCGTLVLAHAAALLAGSPADIFLERARNFVAGFAEVAGALVGFGGLTTEQEAAFRAVLIEHGVPPEAADDRVQAAVAKVGPGHITQALMQKNQWQALKAAGSRPGCMFKFVAHDELQAHIQTRGQRRHGLAVSSPKAKKQKAAKRAKPQAPLQLDPSLLQLSPGSFVTADGSPLMQLSFEEVQSQASGISFCAPAQAIPFIQDGRNISVDPLALVVTAELPMDVTHHGRVSTVRFPAIYMPTSEAVLVLGSLIQLGDEEVRLKHAEEPEVDGIDTITCRMNLYRDETSLSWDQVSQAPIRTILQGVQGLRVCKDGACNQACGLFHPSLVFLDVWARQFTRLTGAKAKPAEAEVFQAYIRVPASAPLHLFRLPNAGLYFEPRAADASGPHAAWSVVWLPGADKLQAQHAQKTCDRALGLARIGVKFGVRTKESDEQAVFNALRPHHEYSRVRVVHRYRAHPLPFGMQRAAVAQLIRGWGWQAKPLQPDRGDGLGSAWLLGAAEEPPSLALPVGKAFVLLAKLPDHTRRPPAASVCASARTIKHILLDDDADHSSTTVGPDPWSNGPDPWAKARGSTDVATQAEPAAPTKAVTKLNQLEGELRQDLEDLVQRKIQAASADPPPGLSEQEKRLHQLEVGVSELQQQGRKFESWFQNVGSKVQDQAQAITALQGTVQEQQHELGCFRTEVQTTVTQAVGSVQTEMTRQLSAQLQGQMEQIQALFAEKKMRH